MTIPAVPLPRIRSLLQAVAAPLATGAPWRLNHRQGDVAQVYRRGSFALAAAVQTVITANASDRAIVWIPGYFCNEALEPLRRLPVTLRFYPVQADLTPDWSALAEFPGGQSGSVVFVLVHYFGFPNAILQAKSFCEQHQVVLLEDAAHVLQPGGGIGDGDLSIFSPRKLLAVPSGGILVASQAWATHLMKVSARQGGNADTIRWLAKRLAQKLFVKLHIPWHRFKGVVQQDCSPGSTDGLPHRTPGGYNPFDLKLLTVMAQDMDAVMERRRRNYRQLLGWTEHLVGARPLFARLPDGVCPYAFPLLVNQSSSDLVATLRSQGIPASQWPDLPPEVLGSQREHKISIHTFERLLLLPVHQSLTSSQIDRVGQQLCAALTGDSKTSDD
ncbi:MAG: DegT/DnrJ/EryC1/StrS family aminotransferase [Chloroflexi bacterium]|nr:DegT/DnrJ/EryC1/StrS family aminotransferase [Chloroflexota bacterium]MDA1219307.1 DegT/DnrJ/EryC1/StrS family aminotransferase [Chloroflexota bacterium]